MPVIVVGIDDSANARRAFEFALAEARLQGATLRVVHAWLMPLPVAMPGPVLGGIPVEYGPPIAEQLEHAREQADALVDSIVSGHETGGVEIERLAIEGEASAALLEAASDADMLVVGSRGRGGFAGLVLGSVSQQCAHHASCPVVIVPYREDDQA